ncbi:recombinase family protein [Chitinimonas sp. JJ19]|uniref:recombinase family protein n=1 Tax=Chitinimonas sp. JJ19 TaxID=3109352 RepID=UPI003000FD35
MITPQPKQTESSLGRGMKGLRAAAYVRMSTEHQQYSTENQLSAIEHYAASRGVEIVHVYADEGKSGLRLEGRNALQQLLKDAESGTADFSAVLVYDVSRWGRFQDPDESAGYEIRCKHAGVAVHYCAEQFENDGSPVSSIIKSVKRTMAGEYSRELSVKVFAGQTRQIQLGHRQGGPAGFGLRRQLIDHAGQPKTLLARGEHKSIQTDRVILVPGPEEEQEVIRHIYELFVSAGLTEKQIAASLNRRGFLTDRDQLWTRGCVHQVLINEKYIGNNVWNRTSFKLKQQYVQNPKEAWIRADGVFAPIVERGVFEQAQQIILARSVRLSDEEMLVALRGLLQERGSLSGMIIDESEQCPSSSAYTSRFGSILRCYALIGYQPNRDYHYLEVNRRLRARYPELVTETLRQIEALGGWVDVNDQTDLLTINEEFTVSINLCRCFHTKAGSRRWVIRFDSGLLPDITVVVRMNPDGDEALDYYLLPVIDLLHPKLRLADHNEAGLDAYRYENLDALHSLASRVPLQEVWS